MPSTLRHGGFAITVPSGWTDQSTLVLVGPPASSMLPTAMAVQEAAPSVSVRFMASAEPDPRVVLHHEFEQLQMVAPDAEVKAQGALSAALGEGWTLELETSVSGHPMRQLLACFVLADTTVLAAAQAPASSMQAHRSQLLATLTSMTAVSDEDAS